MSQEAVKHSVAEALGLTEAQETQRKAAETWVEDAIAKYQSEIDELRPVKQSLLVGGFGRTAVAPSISAAPKHIKHGTQIDQEIWQAENAQEEDDYDESWTQKDDELQAHEERTAEIYEVLEGVEDYDRGLLGDRSRIKDGINPNTDELVDIDTLLQITAPYAALQEERVAVLNNEQPDPIRDQMHIKFAV